MSCAPTVSCMSVVQLMLNCLCLADQQSAARHWRQSWHQCAQVGFCVHSSFTYTVYHLILYFTLSRSIIVSALILLEGVSAWLSHLPHIKSTSMSCHLLMRSTHRVNSTLAKTFLIKCQTITLDQHLSLDCSHHRSTLVAIEAADQQKACMAGNPAPGIWAHFSLAPAKSSSRLLLLWPVLQLL